MKTEVEEFENRLMGVLIICNWARLQREGYERCECISLEQLRAQSEMLRRERDAIHEMWEMVEMWIERRSAEEVEKELVEVQDVM